LAARDEARVERGAVAADGLYVIVLIDVEVAMDWPNRSLWSRFAWLRIRVSIWHASRAHGGLAEPRGEPTWWNEFEEAFWSHVRARTPGVETVAPPD
jgi:hypothetical protein